MNDYGKTQTLFQNACVTHYFQQYLAYINVLLLSLVFCDLSFLFLIPFFPSLLMKHTHTPACFPVGHEWLCCFHVCFQNTLAGVVCIAPHPEEQTHLHTHMVDNIQDRLVIDFFFYHTHKHTQTHTRHSSEHMIVVAHAVLNKCLCMLGVKC